MRPRLAGQRREVGERAQRSIGVDREERQRAAGVVGQRKKPAGGIDRQVHAVDAAGRL